MYAASIETARCFVNGAGNGTFHRQKTACPSCYKASDFSDLNSVRKSTFTFRPSASMWIG